MEPRKYEVYIHDDEERPGKRFAGIYQGANEVAVIVGSADARLSILIGEALLKYDALIRKPR